MKYAGSGPDFKVKTPEEGVRILLLRILDVALEDLRIPTERPGAEAWLAGQSFGGVTIAGISESLEIPMERVIAGCRRRAAIYGVDLSGLQGEFVGN